ncbi:hypothetical protein RYX36_024588 [Vicia faba]
MTVLGVSEVCGIGWRIFVVAVPMAFGEVQAQFRSPAAFVSVSAAPIQVPSQASTPHLTSLECLLAFPPAPTAIPLPVDMNLEYPPL